MAGDETDLSGSTRIPLLVEMVKSLSRAATPDEAFGVYAETMRKLYPAMAFVVVNTKGLEGGRFRIVLQGDHRGRVQVQNPIFDESEQELPVREGGFVGDLVVGDGPRLLAPIEIADDAVLGDFLSPYRSCVAVPVFEQGEAARWIVLLGEEAGALTKAILEDVVIWENMMAAILQNIATAQKLREAHDRGRREIERIAAIQRALLPQRLPEIPGVRLAASYETFDVAGGDMYELHEFGTGPEGAEGDGRWAVAVGDVSGHGPGAAVVMAMVEAMIMAYPREKPDPRDVLASINRRLCHRPIENSFVTLIVALYDSRRRRLTYACAGHPPILLRRLGPDEEFVTRRLEAVGGPPLGVQPDSTYLQATIDLQVDDTLVFYTDGITEARSRDGKFFGVDGIERALSHCYGDAECVVDTVMEELKRHEAGGRPQDDQTLLAMEIVE